MSSPPNRPPTTESEGFGIAVAVQGRTPDHHGTGSKRGAT